MNEGDTINTPESQGFVNRPAGNVYQIFVTPPPLTRHPLHQLRTPVSDFVGRGEEQTQCEQALRSGNGAAAICGLRGMGGIGKTELALVVAHNLVHHFPNAQIVVELFGASAPLSPEAALQSVIRAFEPRAKLSDDLPTLKQWYAACLHHKRVLVLADDARNAAQEVYIAERRERETERPRANRVVRSRSIYDHHARNVRKSVERSH
jgi:hypothetical protein